MMLRTGKQQILYYFALILINIAYLLFYNASNRMFQFCLIGAIVFLIIKLIYTNLKLRQFLIVVVLGGIIAFVCIKTEKISLLIIYCFAVSIKNMDLRKIFKLILFCRVLDFLIKVLGSKLGIFEDGISLIYRRTTMQLLERHALGFPIYNMAHLAYSMIILLILVCYYEKLKMWHFGILALFNHFLYMQTFSRTNYVVVYAMILVTVVLKINKFQKFEKIIYFGFYITPFLLAGFALSSTFMYANGTFWIMVDDLLETRVSIANLLLNRYGIRMFGTNLGADDMDYGMISFLIQYGILLFVCLFYSIYKCIDTYVKQHKNEYLVAIFGVTLIGFSESIFDMISVNLLIFFIADILFNSSNKLVIYKR